MLREGSLSIVSRINPTFRLPLLIYLFSCYRKAFSAVDFSSAVLTGTSGLVIIVPFSPLLTGVGYHVHSALPVPSEKYIVSKRTRSAG